MARENLTYIYEAIDKFSGVADRINKKIKANQKAMKGLNVMSKKMQQVGKDLTRRVTLPLLAAGTASAVAFATFESGLVNVGTLIGKKQFTVFKDDLEEASKAAIMNGFSIRDVNKSLFDTVSAIGDVDKSMAIFKISQQLAIAGVTDLAISTDGMTSIMNAYNLETAQAGRVAEAFFSSQRIGKTTVGELAANIGKVAPIAKNAGVSFEELLATTSALTLGGLKTDEATTALRGAFNALINPAEGAMKILKDAEVPIGATELRSKGLAFALEKLLIVSKKYPDELAKAIPNVRAFTAVAALEEEKLKKISIALADIERNHRLGTGVLEAYTMQNITLSRVMKRLWGQIKVVGIEIGQVLSPYILKLTNFLSPLIQGFINLSRTKKGIIVLGAVIVAILPPLLAVAGTIGLMISTIGLIPTSIAAAVTLAIPLIGILVLRFEAVMTAVKKIGEGLKSIFTLGFGSEMQNYEGFKPTFNQGMQSPIGGMNIGGEASIKVIAPKGTATVSNPKRQRGNMLSLGMNLEETYG